MASLVIVTPVLNDWDSFRELAREIAGLPGLAGHTVRILAVDDGSMEIEPPAAEDLGGCVSEIRILALNANQGHQRAIALGLSYAAREMSCDHVVVMDSDGEDKPDVIEALLAEQQEAAGSIIVAKRAKRSESPVFKIFYAIYKLVFHFLTGKPISFGNFCLIPYRRLPNLLYNSGIWNNFAATILKSRVDIRFVPTERGTRYHGRSKMSFTSLLLHGLSAISVFTDVVIGRIMATLAGITAISAVIILAVIWIKLFTDTFVPGYATNVILFVATVLSLALFFGLASILTLLSNRNQTSALPSLQLDDHTRSLTVIRAAG